MVNGLSHGDIERSSRLHQAHERSLAIQHAKAVQVVASQASGRDECIELLAMLGLSAQAHRQGRPVAPVRSDNPPAP